MPKQRQHSLPKYARGSDAKERIRETKRAVDEARKLHIDSRILLNKTAKIIRDGPKWAMGVALMRQAKRYTKAKRISRRRMFRNKHKPGGTEDNPISL